MVCHEKDYARREILIINNIILSFAHYIIGWEKNVSYILISPFVSHCYNLLIPT